MKGKALSCMLRLLSIKLNAFSVVACCNTVIKIFKHSFHKSLDDFSRMVNARKDEITCQT